MTTTSLDTVVLETTAIVDLSSAPNDLAPFADGSYQVVFDMSGGATSAGNIRFQGSNDGVNFVTITGPTAFTSASTSELFRIQVINFRYARVNIDVTSGTGGTVTIFAHFLRKN